jgi:uncharacterized membrane protein YqiK
MPPKTFMHKFHALVVDPSLTCVEFEKFRGRTYVHINDAKAFAAAYTKNAKNPNISSFQRNCDKYGFYYDHVGRKKGDKVNDRWYYKRGFDETSSKTYLDAVVEGRFDHAVDEAAERREAEEVAERREAEEIAERREAVEIVERGEAEDNEVEIVDPPKRKAADVLDVCDSDDEK